MEENTQKRLRKCCSISYDKGRLLTGRQTNRLHGLVELLEKDEMPQRLFDGSFVFSEQYHV